IPVFNLFLVTAFSVSTVSAQEDMPHFTRQDTLRGSLNAERAYNVIKYDLSVEPDYANRYLKGRNTITYIDSGLRFMQIDLQPPLAIDSIVQDRKQLSFRREGNVYHVGMVRENLAGEKRQPVLRRITIYYQGHPHQAVKAPWDGGWIFKSDSLGRPWMSVACEGDGASIWFPCKDYLGDEPDSGALLSITVADSLTAIGNGRLKEKNANDNGTTTWTWEVKSPINSYDIIPYIGKYAGWQSTYAGEKGRLDLSFWALDYHLPAARRQFAAVDSMLRCFEYWFGPYPFYEDGYKLVEAPYLGMEHQSNIAYGNHFLQGYSGRDLSGTGWGMKWDFIIVHESGHEWFGNNITCRDVADEWIHESFTAYSETLYTEYYFGKQAGNEYNIGIRKNIQNKTPIIQYYGVNHSPGGTDEYYKGSNMIQTIRQAINDDDLFRKILRGLNQTFYHKTVGAADIEQYINRVSGINFTPVFNQYLRDTRIPALEYVRTEGSLRYRWANCNPAFNLPIRVTLGNTIWLHPTTKWQTIRVAGNGAPQADPNCYIELKEVAGAK
ncbi:MAG TPA: M1 family metallopeptidase, partial [Puia sp.]|nr:M1 family metallopeptidase [Puia sp.]